MKYEVDILRDMFAVMRISNIAIQYLDITPAVYIFQPAPIIKGVVLGKRFDLVALFNESLRKMRTDETIGPGYQNILHELAYIGNFINRELFVYCLKPRHWMNPLGEPPCSKKTEHLGNQECLCSTADAI